MKRGPQSLKIKWKLCMGEIRTNINLPYEKRYAHNKKNVRAQPCHGKSLISSPGVMGSGILVTCD